MSDSQRTWMILATVSVALVGISVFLLSDRNTELSPPSGVNSSSKLARPDSKSDSENHIAQPQTVRVSEIPAEPLTLEKAKELLAKYKDIKDAVRRSMLCAELITDLCEAGLSEDAWDLIEEGAGQVRRFELSAFFKNSQLEDEELFRMMSMMPFKGEASLAYASYLQRFDLNELSDFLNSPQSDELQKLAGSDLTSRRTQHAVNSRLTEKMGELNFLNSVDEQRKISDMAINHQKKGFIGEDHLIAILKSDRSRSPFDKWNVMEASIGENVPSSDANRDRNTILESMVKADSRKAVEKIQQQEGDRGLADMQTAIKEWIKLDSVEAAQWFSESEDSLSPSAKNGAALGFFRQALGYGELDSAKQWAELVTNKNYREQALGLIAKKQASPE